MRREKVKRQTHIMERQAKAMQAFSTFNRFSVVRARSLFFRPKTSPMRPYRSLSGISDCDQRKRELWLINKFVGEDLASPLRKSLTIIPKSIIPNAERPRSPIPRTSFGPFIVLKRLPRCGSAWNNLFDGVVKLRSCACERILEFQQSTRNLLTLSLVVDL